MKQFFLISILLLGIIALAGCEVEEGSIATPQNQDTQANTANPTESASDVQEEKNEAEDLLTTSVSADVDTSSPKNWDADAEDDGVIVYPSLNDKNGNTVQFEGVELNVDIEVWDTVYNDNYDQVKNNKIYTGQGTIDSWKDGNFFYEGGIRVPFDEMESSTSDSDYGFLIIKIHLPDGRVLEAQSDPSTEMGIRIR